jgi:hypothetical protein
MKRASNCYLCDRPATTREHMPPRSFFPKGGSLQLKTVPSCAQHNNQKSHDDQYLLAHICMHAAASENLASKIFLRSIAPALKRSPAFRSSLAAGFVVSPRGGHKYKVDVARFDSFFDHLACAIFFDRYGVSFDARQHILSHCYLTLETKDADECRRNDLALHMVAGFLRDFRRHVSVYEADKLGEIVYRNVVLDPGGKDASITIGHTFYGVFEVVSLLSRKITVGEA